MKVDTKCEHDWVVVKAENYTSIVERITKELHTLGSIPKGLCYMCEVQVCIKCGRVIDEISEQEDTVRRVCERKNLAKQIYKKYLENVKYIREE